MRAKAWILGFLWATIAATPSFAGASTSTRPIGAVLVTGVLPERHTLAVALAPALQSGAQLIPAADFVREGRVQGLMHVAHNAHEAIELGRHLGLSFVVQSDVAARKSHRVAHLRIIDVVHGKLLSHRSYPLPPRSEDIWPEAIAGDVRNELERRGLVLRPSAAVADVAASAKKEPSEKASRPMDETLVPTKPSEPAPAPAATKATLRRAKTQSALNVTLGVAPMAGFRHGRLITQTGSIAAATGTDHGLGRALGGGELKLEIFGSHIGGRLVIEGLFGRQSVGSVATTPTTFTQIFGGTLSVGPRFCPLGFHLDVWAGPRIDARPIAEGPMAGYTALGLLVGGTLETPRIHGLGFLAEAAFLGPAFLGGEAWRMGHAHIMTGASARVGSSLDFGRVALAIVGRYEERWASFDGPATLMIPASISNLRLRDTYFAVSLETSFQW